MSNTGEVQKTIEDTIQHLGVEYSLVIEHDEVLDTRKFLISTPEKNALIGNKGENFLALNYLIKRIHEAQYPSKERTTRFFLDVNNHQSKKMEEIKNKAIMLAGRAKYFENDIEMEPMSPYERMVAHSVLASVEGITTESTGVGFDRRVVIKYS